MGNSRVSPEARAIGREIVRMTEPLIARLAAEGEPDVRCKTCAFREGTIPNGCIQTVLDAVKCITEKTPFMCHARFADGARTVPDVCHGWFAIAAHTRDQPGVPCPWPFSPPDDASETERQAYQEALEKSLPGGQTETGGGAG